MRLVHSDTHHLDDHLVLFIVPPHTDTMPRARSPATGSAHLDATSINLGRLLARLEARLLAAPGLVPGLRAPERAKLRAVRFWARPARAASNE